MKKVVFYRTVGGNEVVQDFLRSLPVEDRHVVGCDLRYVQFAYPVGPPFCRSLGKGLWELRSSLPSGRECRLICTYDSKSKTIVALSGFIKKTRKTPASELKLASNRRADLEQRE